MSIQNKENISTIFLLPCLKFPIVLKNKFYENGFIGTYINSDILIYPYETLLIMFHPTVINREFCLFSEQLEDNPNFIESVDIGPNKIVYVYKIPSNYRQDYFLFLKGKYSEFSSNYKSNFPIIVLRKDNNGKYIKDGKEYIRDKTEFYHIFNRTEELKNFWKKKLNYNEETDLFEDLELYEKPDTRKEMLLIEKYRENFYE